MNDKMTSGEIAKKAGVSQKAVRLYDEKGLLKPTDYSEGNYRLYDQAALEILEKIVALKQIGFSLEEIRDNLADGGASDIEAALKIQLKQMEEKRYQIDKVISAINRTLDRKSEGLDWDDVAAIVQNVGLDQGADERHWDALKHTGDEMDWYVRIFNSLDIKENEKVLDLGCGFAKLWRNNWDRIPQGTKVYGYDIHGSWADDFEQFLKDNSDKLATGTDIDLFFEDVEDESTWTHINGEKKYSMIIAHYLIDALKDVENFISRASKKLTEDGVMSLNAFGNIPETRLKWWINFFEELELDASSLEEELAAFYEEKDRSRKVLMKYFNRIDEAVIPCNFTFDSVDDIYKDLEKCLPNHKMYFENNCEKIKKRIEAKLSGGSVVIPHDGTFWRLSL